MLLSQFRNFRNGLGIFSRDTINHFRNIERTQERGGYIIGMRLREGGVGGSIPTRTGHGKFVYARRFLGNRAQTVSACREDLSYSIPLERVQDPPSSYLYPTFEDMEE